MAVKHNESNMTKLKVMERNWHQRKQCERNATHLKETSAESGKEKRFLSGWTTAVCKTKTKLNQKRGERSKTGTQEEIESKFYFSTLTFKQDM